MNKGTKESIYQGLSLIYDDIMHDIDYEDWADYVDELIQKYNPDAEDLLELACGTGNHALSLEELESYNITATDFSEAMLDVARTKTSFKSTEIEWKQLDFTNITDETTYDVVIMLFDSINYILSGEEVVNVFNGIKKILNPGGIFIFDFTTPENSEAAAELMNEEGTTPDDFKYSRKSYYLPSEKMHYNEFEIEKLSADKMRVEKRFREIHKQRIYTFAEMKSFVEQSNLTLLASFEELDFEPANNKSHRITMVTQ